MVKKYGNRNYSKKIKRNRKNIGKIRKNTEKKYDKNRDKTGTINSIVFLFFPFFFYF